ncbi:MAG TPA: hypothetical protein VF520_08365 [Thermoleophilaceae bacterium]
MRLAPFGQMKPCEKTSSRSPRMPSTDPFVRRSSRPQVASQSGHVA